MGNRGVSLTGTVMVICPFLVMDKLLYNNDLLEINRVPVATFPYFPFPESPARDAWRVEDCARSRARRSRIKVTIPQFHSSSNRIM